MSEVRNPRERLLRHKAEAGAGGDGEVARGALEALFTRTPDSPVVSGDMLGPERIEGFRYDRKGHDCAVLDKSRTDRGLGYRASPEFDQVLLSRNGAESVARPYSDVRYTDPLGTRTPLRLHELAPDRIREASEVLQQRFGELLRLHELTFDWHVERFLRDVWLAEHEIWIVGGPVRDILMGRHAYDVKDLDCTGTMPVGHLWSLLTLRAGRSLPHLRLGGRGPTPVIRILHPDSHKAIFEYKPLELRSPLFSSPVNDHDLANDGDGRDLTVNALAYDPINHMLYDPTGQGRKDVASVTLRPGVESAALDPLRMFLRVLKAVHGLREFEPDCRPAATKVDAEAERIKAKIMALRDRVDVLEELSRFCPDDHRPEEDKTRDALMTAAKDLKSKAAVDLALLLVSRHE